ncbi:MAG TPA: class I SAM-dependent methyltransferase [Phycisphaerae bacterium]|nr:class I SAM-dependent methyltransferase [Phycisphaerae bacterium]
MSDAEAQDQPKAAHDLAGWQEQVITCWDRNAPTWTELVRQGCDAYRELFNSPAMLAFIGEVRGRTVLDAGCGEGHNTRMLARRGARVTGIDISPKMIELAVGQEQSEPLGIRYEVGSFSCMSMFDEASFDLVVSTMAIMDGPDLGGAARELLRVLRPGGELVFSILHPCFATHGYGWIRDEGGTCVKMTVSNYFDNEPRIERWTFSKGAVPDDAPPFAVPRFPRTLSEYVNTFMGAGFVLTEVAEPRPSAEVCRDRPWLQRFRDHAALLLYVRASKPDCIA